MCKIDRKFKRADAVTLSTLQMLICQMTSMDWTNRTSWENRISFNENNSSMARSLSGGGRSCHSGGHDFRREGNSSGGYGASSGVTRARD